jgi:hypothetical protein
MGKEHAPTTIAVYAQIVEDFAGRLSLYALPVFLPYI